MSNRNLRNKKPSVKTRAVWALVQNRNIMIDADGRLYVYDCRESAQAEEDKVPDDDIVPVSICCPKMVRGKKGNKKAKKLLLD